MPPTWSLAYLAGWVVATVVVFLAGKRLNDRDAPAAHPAALSIVAGLMWPMLIVGAVEFVVVATCVRVRDWRATAEVPEVWLSRAVVANRAVTLR